MLRLIPGMQPAMIQHFLLFELQNGTEVDSQSETFDTGHWS